VWYAAVPLVGYGMYRYFRYLKRREEGPAPPASVLQSPAGTTPDGESPVNPAGAAAAAREAGAALDDSGPKA
jgi:hypothetical protein